MRKLTNQTMDLVNLEGCQVLSSRTYHRVVIERRLMAFCLACCVAGGALFVLSVATIRWAYVSISHNENQTTVLQLGIWGEYRTDYTNEKTEESVWIRHFPDLPQDRPRLRNKDLPHYYRAQAVFSVIAIGLMILSTFVGIYSLIHHRYMYKRLAAGLMFIDAMCVLVVVQVLVHSIDEWSSFSSSPSSPGDNEAKNNFGADNLKQIDYGMSTMLAYVVFGTYCASALVFLIGGRKNKGLHAATMELEQEDRPVNLS